MYEAVFSKSRRAQTKDDYETWVESGVSPTLNVFDNGGETRATVLIVFHPHRSDGARIQGDTINTLTAFMGTGGLNTPMVLIEEGDMEVIGIQNTVIGRSDTAGPQGKGYTGEGDPMFTIDTTSPHAVAVTPIHDSATRYAGKRKLSDRSYSQDGKANGLGIGQEGDPMNTLTGGDRHAVAYDEYNDSISDVHHTLRAGTKQSNGALVNSVVRRLTPLECELLQGFPPGWTEFDSDGKAQADSSRYKQMGNAVAVPVVDFLLHNMVKYFDYSELPIKKEGTWEQLPLI